LPIETEGERQPNILWIGRLQPWKRPDLFVKIANKFIGKPYKFYMIGRKIGSTDCLLNVRNENFEYLNEIELQDVNDLLSKSKLLVCTSESEGFPNTFIQAWLRGVPVHTLYVDPDDFIKEKGLGILSPNFDKMCEDINLLMENDSRWKQLSDRCFEFAFKKFNISHHVDQLEKVAANKKSVLGEILKNNVV
jgi:glycosyltransferase involved in cell wall biosynthesis